MASPEENLSQPVVDSSAVAGSAHVDSSTQGTRAEPSPGATGSDRLGERGSLDLPCGMSLLKNFCKGGGKLNACTVKNGLVHQVLVALHI